MDELENPSEDLGLQGSELTRATRRRRAEELWYVQVDAVAKVGAAVEG